MTNDLDREEFCYVTTVGRRTGKPHTVEIWFAARDATLYILAGGGDRADFVRNIAADPSVVVKVGDHAYRGLGRIVTDPDEIGLARELVPVKYAHREDGLEEWAQTALPVAVDIKFP
jgi:deazaflavin-dependent oxidoreductase (nitroreductase family)